MVLPWPLKRDAIKSVFPPGAAQQSMMVSPGCGSTTDTTRPVMKYCLVSIYCLIPYDYPNICKEKKEILCDLKLGERI